MGRIKRTKEQIEYDLKSESKICCVCELRRDFVDFYNFKNKSDGKSYRCKSCDSEARSSYHTNNYERVKEKHRTNTLKFKYGITQSDYLKMLQRQDGKCAICLSTETRGTHSFSVDHNHTTGKVRGLLCNNCNRALGMFGDDLQTLKSALEYMEQDAIH